MNINSEFEQSVLRIVVILLVFCYALTLFYFKVITDEFFTASLIFGGAYFTASLLLSVAAKYQFEYAVLRRTTGMVLDVLMTSMCLYYFSEYGAPLFVVYLWVTIGNGFRYGIEYLLTSALLSIIGFLWVATNSSFWSDLPAMVATGVVVMTVVPVYMAVLLKRLQTEKTRAEVANRESRFIANISHEIRTPLNAVAGFSELLDGAKDKAYMTRLINGIQNSSRSLTALVDGVLEFSKIEAGVIEVEYRPFDVRELLESIESVFSLQADKKGIKYSCEIDANVPPLILGDLNRLRQILVNLVGNAIKFTDSGYIKLLLTKQTDQHKDSIIRFEVEDSGVGIKEELIPHIFERFRQADDSAQRTHSGTGLGTAIAKHLVELMGGQIGLESQYGRGSTFWFSIPCEVGPAGDISMASGQEPEEAGQLLLSDGDKIRVLVAEDNEMNRQVFRGMLTKLGISAIFADSGPVALGKLLHDRFDLVMLDIQMPGMSGFDVISHYNEDTDVSERAPIVIVTGDATTDIKAQCNQLGVSRFLTKPVELYDLQRVISELVFRKGEVPASV
jgi:two-component system sensor histidine kinase RpfC